MKIIYVLIIFVCVGCSDNTAKKDAETACNSIKIGSPYKEVKNSIINTYDKDAEIYFDKEEYIFVYFHSSSVFDQEGYVCTLKFSDQKLIDQFIKFNG